MQRPPAGGGAADAPARRHVGLAFGLAIAAALLWAWSSLQDTRALRELPQAERDGLCARTRENVEQICKGPGHPRDFCRSQALVLLDLPECDAACRAAARAALQADSAVK